MNYRYQKPHPLLSDYVRTVLVIEGFSDPGQSNFPLVTQGMPALFYKGDKITLYGKSVPAEAWQISDNETITAYFFLPFMMAPFFNIEARKLMSAPVELETAASLEDFLVSKLKTNRHLCDIIKNATDHIMMNSGAEVLSEVLEKLGLTERTFQRMFKKYVGITPIQYRRICQFDQSFSQLRSKNFDSLADVAYDNGFADQSHFIRSFKEFAHTTPQKYVNEGLKGKK